MIVVRILSYPESVAVCSLTVRSKSTHGPRKISARLVPCAQPMPHLDSEC